MTLRRAFACVLLTLSVGVWPHGVAAMQRNLLLLGVGGATAAASGIGPVDFFVDLACTTATTALTVPILNSCTHGNANHGGWGITGTGLTAATHVSNCGLLGSISVDGTTYAIANTSLAMAVDNTGVLRYISASAATPNVGYTRAIAASCITLNTGTLGGTGLWDLIRMNGNVSGAVIPQFSTSKCAGTPGINLETITGATNNSACITTGFSVGSSYWYITLWDSVVGTAQFALFDNTGTQVGSTLTGTQVTADVIGSVDFGQRESGTSTGSNTFENIYVRWSGASTYPVGPANTTQTPVYYIAKSLINNTGSGTALQTTKTIDVPAGATVIVATFSENASMTVTAPTDIGSTNTFTHCVACDVTLAANGRGEIWYVTNATTKAADQFTCNTNASTFRNCAAVVLSAGSFDTGAVGTTSAGSADCTTASFTPTLNAAVVDFAYITAGVVYASGTNYNLLNTNGTSSFASQLRTSVPNASQTATMVQANTSTKWCSAISIKP